MCTTTNARRFARSLSILLITLISHPILTVGLPIPRQEHAPGSDLIAGETFLSILMEGLAQQQHNVADLHHQPSAAEDDKSFPEFGLKLHHDPPARVTRTFKNDDLERNLEVAKTSDSDLDEPSIQIRNDIDTDERSEPEDGTIIAVSVSSSVGHSMINKHVYTHEEKNEDVVIEDPVPETTDTPTTTLSTEVDCALLERKAEETNQSVDENLPQMQDQEAIASEDAPSLIAEANKSEFHVDETEPISRDYHDPLPEQNANQPSGMNLPSTFSEKSYPGTVIYHNEGSNNRARSVSYSTVIQALPSAQKAWTPQSRSPGVSNNPGQEVQGRPSIQARQNTTVTSPTSSPNPSSNQQQHPNQGLLKNGNTEGVPSSVAESKEYYVTSKYEEPSRYYSPEPTERNWGIPEQNYHEPSKPYTPIVYAQPEQNYEVDEAVSVETNGRAHGIQPVQSIQQHPEQAANNQDPRKPPLHNSPHGKILPGGNASTPGKKDDNQKVGYVVEGRNYRKYRVEERTSDGFIVGEYGVVRHDDGSLRGVRYTADGTISPRLIYDALMKFLSL